MQGQQVTKHVPLPTQMARVRSYTITESTELKMHSYGIIPPFAAQVDDHVLTRLFNVYKE